MQRSRTQNPTPLLRFPLLKPGQIDCQIARERLALAPAPVWDAPTLAACTRLYHRYVEPATGAGIPDSVFCDTPRWLFLEYLTRHCGIVLVGSNEPDLTQLEPTVLVQNVEGWNRPRLIAFSESVTPIFQAILDVPRLQRLNRSLRTMLVTEGVAEDGKGRLRCYFGLDYRALAYAPWRRGTVYCYAKANLPPDFQTTPRLTGPKDAPILPLAKLSVAPWDWPLLSDVQGFDVALQQKRTEETFEGYPWPDDAKIHPLQQKRTLATEMERYLHGRYAEKISLTDLGGRVGVSPFAALRLFQAATGLSPRERQILLRIAEAKRLLLRGRSIAEAAFETGFCDQTHLTRHFQRIVGLTPGLYLRAQESPIRSA